MKPVCCWFSISDRRLLLRWTWCGFMGTWTSVILQSVDLAVVILLLNESHLSHTESGHISVPPCRCCGSWWSRRPLSNQDLSHLWSSVALAQQEETADGVSERGQRVINSLTCLNPVNESELDHIRRNVSSGSRSLLSFCERFGTIVLFISVFLLACGKHSPVSFQCI